MKLCFVWEWGRAKEIYPNWRDGLRACMEIISKIHKVDWLLDEAPKKEYDWILTWCDSNSSFSKMQTNYSAKRGIFLTTHPSNYANLKGFDVVFCESSIIYDEVRSYGIRAVKAFGTDTKFFCPDEKIKQDIEYFYPACFSPWKMQSEIAHLGKKLLCVGTVMPDGQEQLASCRMNEVQAEVGYFPVEKIRAYYRRAKRVIIPAVHGSERTVLESMSHNIVPKITKPKVNKRAYSYIEEYEKVGGYPRDFVIKNYSAEKYAETVLKSLQ
jgi:hypothetical protein